MTTESSWLDGIFGAVTNDSQAETLQDDSKSALRNEIPKLEVLFELPISDEHRNNNLKWIKINPQYQIVTSVRNHGNFKTYIKYENIDGRFRINWEETNNKITNDLREGIRTKEINSIIKSLLSILDIQRENIEYYINGIPTNGPLDAIREYVVNPDESDVTDATDKEENETLNVSGALKLNQGYWKVKGSIRSISEPFKLIQGYTAECSCGNVMKEDQYKVPKYKEPKLEFSCKGCKRSGTIIYDYINALSVELQDDETFSDIERLNCILLDTDTSNIKIGEKVIIKGQIHVIQKNQKGNLVPVLFSRNHVDYQNRNEIVMNELDKQAINKFAKMFGESVISKLVDMYDRNIIGLNTAKKGMLLSLVSSGDDLNDTSVSRGTRTRIHCILVGNPGVAKSSLLKKAVKLISNSRYESAQHASGRSLTAIVDKENEHHCLRLGPVPLSKKSVCALNEFGNIPFDEQKYLLDVMEEGEFTINKYGINSTIQSPTTIIASTNLLNSSYDPDLSRGTIHLTQIPCIPPARDRFDLIIVVADETSDDALLEYVDKKLKILSERIPNYDIFLQKYIQCAREIKPELDPKCTDQIKYYYSALKKSNPELGSNRVLETIIRLCKSMAKLKLKQIVDERDVTDAIEFYNLLISKYVDGSNVPTEPDKYAYEKCFNILKRRHVDNTEVRFEDILYEACETDGVVKAYILDSRAEIIDRNKLKIETNHKARQVKDLLINNQFVRIVKRKPLTLQIEWAMCHQ
ncbi:MAG TPA: AAA family ATPase [Candidatus Nitrosocosmicus sp.]|nr:AAA family ATPase [Candidatus Nitrosocosmicus sp.]